MTHPLTPREKVARALSPKCWEFYDRHVDDPRMAAEIKHEVAPSLDAADAILTALASGSGDHAELIEDAMDALQIIDAFPSNQGEVEGRITEKGDRMLSSCTRDVRRALETLLAENAALRGDLEKSEADRIRGVDDRMSWTRRALEAERKLAEAVGLLGTLSLMFHPDSAHGRHIRTFLECSR